jgi:hypothetical protein
MENLQNEETGTVISAKNFQMWADESVYLLK